MRVFQNVQLLTLLCAFGCMESPDSPGTGTTGDAAKSGIPTMTKANGTEAVDLPVMEPGMHSQTIVRDDGTTLRFTIVVPAGYAPQSRWPLIMALHFGGDVTPFYGRGVIEALVGPAFEDINAIIVAPDSIAGTWTNQINEAAVLQIMDSVVQSYSVDRSRTVLTGFSMGGEGSFYIGGRHQDRFSAVIPVAGRPTSDAQWQTPLYAIHSSADTVVPIGPTRDYIEQLGRQKSEATLFTVDGIPH